MKKGLIKVGINVSLLVFVTLIITSCSKYQYVSLSSNLKQTTSREFIYENDSLRICYQFAGKSCPIQIEIFNKLAQELYIDWSRSALIIDEYSMPYWFDATQPQNELPAVFRNTRYMKPSQSIAYWQNYNNEQISTLAPKSRLKMSSISVRSTFLPIQPYDEIKTAGTTQGSMQEIHLFDDKNAPLRFSSLLKIATNANFNQSSTIEHTFWSSEIFEVMEANASSGNANQFHIRESTGVGTALIYLSIFGGLFAIFWVTN